MRIFPALLLLSAVAVYAEPPAAMNAPKKVGPGQYEIGPVKLDEKTRTVTVPAVVNMVDGLIEYLMVRPEGSVHESLLRSEAQPQDLHMAMLLLGAKGMAQEKGDKAPARIDAEYLQKAPKLTGDKISIKVTWKDKEGAEKTVPVEKWIVRSIPVPRKPSKIVPAEEGPWVYTGSYFYENRFVAQTEGVFGSMVTYPAALINNPRKGSDDDHVWFVNKNVVPPKDTPVTVTIQLEAAPAAPAAPAAGEGKPGASPKDAKENQKPAKP